MSRLKVKTQPDLSLNSPAHLEAIAKGKEHFKFQNRNVIDRFKEKSEDEIKVELRKTALPCSVMMAQIIGDFNFGAVIRVANNFNVNTVYYYGNKHFDRRPTVGTHHYTNVVFLSSLEEVQLLKQDYVFVGLENNISGTILLPDFKWKCNSMLLLGEEGVGIPQPILNLVDFKVEIPSRGSVRSLNVASAASIALYDYYCKYT